jgi:putative ABC transport system permease protein
MEFSQAGKNYPFSFRVVAPGSLETLEIELLERFGAPEGPLQDWIINETFYKQLLQDFSPEDIASGDFSARDLDPDDSRAQFNIGGVMKDFHYSSLHNGIENFAFVMSDPGRTYHRWLLVRFAEGQSASVLGAIHRMMDTHFHEKALDYFLLEDILHEQYAASGDLSAIVRLFAILAILIALTGLYGLVHFMTRRRSKEIGLRKLHGAGTRQIILMLNLGFLRWIVGAFIIACPLTLLALEKWMVHFTYKTTLPWWIFVVPGIVVVCITMLAVSWQTIAAAQAGPVKTINLNQ